MNEVAILVGVFGIAALAYWAGKGAGYEVGYDECCDDFEEFFQRVQELEEEEARNEV